MKNTPFRLFAVSPFRYFAVSPFRCFALSLICLFALSPFRLSTQPIPVGRTVAGDPAKARIYEYPNGLKLYVSVATEKPRVQSVICVHAGSKNDPSDATGLAHYLEHMVFKGTDRFGTLDPERELPMIEQIESLFEQYRATTSNEQRATIYRQIDSVSSAAARLAIPNEYDKMCQALGCTGTNAFTTTDVTAYINDVPNNRLDAYYALEAERFRKPILRLFHTELEAVYEEKNISLDEDRSLAYDTLLAALFPTHTYGTQSTLGTTEHLKNPSMKRIREYYDTYYQPSNMSVFVAGDVVPDSIARIIARTLGAMPSKPAPKWTVNALPPITRPIVKTVTGPDAEWIDIAFRWPGASHADLPALKMMDMLLANGKTGLIDMNVVQQQRTLDASSEPVMMADYGYHYFSGRANPGQTLEEVRDILLAQIDMIRKGAFDTTLFTAIIRDLRKREMLTLRGYQGKAFWMMGSVSLNLPYEAYVGEINAMAAVTPADVIRVANMYYGNNYVAVFKRTGERTDIVQVEKPAITPVPMNSDTTSSFARAIITSPSRPIEPVFINYDRDVAKDAIRKDVPIYAAQNKIDQLVDMMIYVHKGSLHDRYLELALDYLPYLSTPEMSASAIAREQYRLGMSLYTSMNDRSTRVGISCLEETFEESLALLYHLVNNCQPNEEALSSLKEQVKKDRQDALNDKYTLLYAGLYPYAVFGERNPTLNELTDAEIDAVTSKDLIDRLHDVFDTEHCVVYYGPRTVADAARAIRARHAVPVQLRPRPAYVPYTVRPLSSPEVIVLDHDMVQAEVMMFGRSLPKLDSSKAPALRMFSEYFDGSMGSVVFQTLRESKALAYSTSTNVQTPADTVTPYVMMSTIGTQSDKLIEAIDGFRELLTELPVSTSSLEHSRSSVRQSIQTQRREGMEIVLSYLRSLETGITTDQSQYLYRDLDTFTMDDIASIYNEAIKGRCNVIAIIGSKDKLDLKALEKYGRVRIVTKADLFPY